MNSRKGATLIEVLVAIFVMGIGLIALLTLFPLGALRMAQAIQDEKCAVSVVNANAIATIKDIRNDNGNNTVPSVFSPPLFFSSLPHLDAFKDPIKNLRRLAADPDGPSYPVFVDPIGFQNAIPSSPSQQWVGMGSGGNFAKGLIARSQPSWIAGSTTTTFQWFTLLDDLIFDSSDLQGGTPFNFNPSGGTPKVIRRDIRYSWAYMLQRPRSSDPSIVSCSVVVYNKRPLSLSGGLGLAESTYPASFSTNTNTIDVNFAGLPAPNVRAGDWILDSTTYQTPSKTTPGVTYGSAHANFYRVVGVNQTGPTTIEYEVQQPIRGMSNLNPQTTLFSIMVLEGVADVYERGLDRKFN